MVDRNDRNVIDETNPPCTVVITPQIEILKRYINYWKMWTSIMFALFLLTFYCVDKFMIYNEVAFNIYYFALLFFITGFFITYITYIITDIIDTTKRKIYQIYYQSKEHINSKWVALPFFYNFSVKIYTELQENFPELNFVMEEAQAQAQTPSANNNIQAQLVSDYDFRKSVKIFHIQINHNNNKEKVENLYTQKEIEYLILKYAKSYNVSAVVCNNIDEACVTYYNELKSESDLFWSWFWLWFFCFVTIIINIVSSIIFPPPPPPDLPPHLLNYPQYYHHGSRVAPPA
jgi:hypothetical protein